MWVVRETIRLASRIGIAVLIAIVVAEVRAVVGGGDTLRTFRITLLLLGCLMLLLASAGAAIGQKKAHQQANLFGAWRPESLGLGESLTRAGGPTLTPAAVFVGSGVALLALGLFV
jgi:hypothetical protein